MELAERTENVASRTASHDEFGTDDGDTDQEYKHNVEKKERPAAVITAINMGATKRTTKSNVV